MPVRVYILALSAIAMAAAEKTPPTTATAAPATAPFNDLIQPFFKKSCAPCHNDRNASGGVNIGLYVAPSSIQEQRDGWERILQKIRTGEMPPKGIPRPAEEQVNALMGFIHGEFEKADKALKPDPGRVTARRLNRVEYTNTIRDLLGVDFRADQDFPADDSGHGFDNIGDVLTISPVLMEKYLDAAATIASRAIGADPLPKKPVEIELHLKDKRLRRVDRSTVEGRWRLDFDGEYVVRIGLPGERTEDAKPVTMGFWLDGKLIHQMQVETKPSKLVYFNPYSEEEFRVFLPAGDHTFRAGFINDDFVDKLSDKEVYDSKKNKSLNMITLIGPYESKVERPSRKKILICDPSTGQACVDRIVGTLARRAYRRPVTRAEVANLTRFVALGKAEGLSTEQGLQLAVRAMLVSPHFLFRIERDQPAGAAAGMHQISNLELASRLSYFLWSTMPDEELLSLAEAGKLKTPAVLEGQVARMLKDEKFAAFAANFAGQWLETRNLDSVKPDPQKFPEWGPELRDAMKTETRMFFETVVRENLPLSEFLDSRFTFLNERLAKHYGIEGVKGDEFRRVELATDQRGGILAHASVLTVSSYPTRTSPVIRGKYVLENILGAPPPQPPPDVPALDEDSVGNKGSLRQQLEKHRSNAVCASCHARMDVLGFGLENYDATGKWRTVDGKFPIEPAGTFPNGKSFVTPAEMRALLKQDLPDFTRCLTEKMLTYALGRGLERYDRKTVNQITKNVAESGYRFQTVIHEIVRSLPFQMRRPEVSQNQPKSTTRPKEVASR
jgi:mono/diheme cytochrome c family protein